MTSKWLKIWYNIVYYASFSVIYIILSAALTFLIFKAFNISPKESKYISIFVRSSCNVISYATLMFTLYRSRRIVKNFDNITFLDFNKNIKAPPFRYNKLIVTINKGYLTLNTKITLVFWNIGIPCDKVIKSDEKYIYNITRKRINKLEGDDVLYLLYEMGERDLVSNFIDVNIIKKRDRASKLKELL